MDTDRWHRVEELFFAAVAEEPGQRVAVLDQGCADDPRLRAEVEALLTAHRRASTFMESPAFSSENGPAPSPAFLQAGCQISRFAIRRVLGVGGMGVVYQAEQGFPRRIVALKVLRPGRTNPAILRRFQHEAEILARLQHPGIAQIFEAGTTDIGIGPQPYFAMEEVSGEPITDYAQKRVLDVRSRLELMTRVCDAMEYAHHRGIVHRDLKPGNILVDGGGQPKILDFGVARATNSDLAVTTLATDVGELIGTIPYMSPEQVAGDPHDLDARSDVYSLGVVCYELIAGRLPYELTGRTIPDVARIIREQDATRLSSVSRVFRGDLDTILAKTLEKDRSRRYQSAAEFADDLRRFLNREPIRARRPSASYRVRRFVSRNRGLTAGVVAAFLAISAATVIASTMAVRAGRERDRAMGAEMRKQLVSAFLKDLLGTANPFSARHGGGTDSPEQRGLLYAGSPGQVATVVDVLRAGVYRLAGSSLDPLVEAELRHVLGSSLAENGEFPESIAQLQMAVDLRTAHTGAASTETLESLERLTYATLFGGDPVAAIALARPVLKSDQLARGPLDTSTRALAIHVARGLETLKRSEEAIDLLRRLSVNAAAVADPDHEAVISLRLELAYILSNHDNALEALEISRECLSRLSNRPAAQYLYACAAAGVADALYDLGRYGEAAEASRRAVDAYSASYGEDHPFTAYQKVYLAWSLGQADKLEEARGIGEQALDTHRRFGGDDHEWTHRAERGLARILARQGEELDRAEAMARHALAGYERICGSDHFNAFFARDVLGVVLQARGRLAEAEALLRQNVDLGAQSVPGWEYALFLRTLGQCLAERGNRADAERYLLSAWGRMCSTIGSDADAARQTAGDLATLYEAWNVAQPNSDFDAKAAEWRAKLNGD